MSAVIKKQPTRVPGLRRSEKTAGQGRPYVLGVDHEAITDGRALFPSRRVTPDENTIVLKGGHNNKKIGARVVKGRWKGMPIFTLTLEERATCPRYCINWRDCYGNRMQWAHRMEHGDALIRELDHELAELAELHPSGFVVRLHVLGDFYSLAYVRAWFRWLRQYPALHVFGYTARDHADPIGRWVLKIANIMWDRFAIRLSGRQLQGQPAAVTVEGELEALMLGAIVCPAQTERTSCCGTCGLCWTTTKPIAFLRH